MKEVMLVGLGGAVGSVLRHLIAKYVTGLALFKPFPLGTFIVNLTGSLLIGFLMGYLALSDNENHYLKILLITGFCGGYTTFSAFSMENIKLLQAGNYATSFAYIALSLFVCLSATALGFKMGQAIQA